MAKAVSDTSKFVQLSNNHAVETADGMVIYQNDREKVHYLNPTATIIYELCDTHQTTASVAAFLQSMFDLPEPPTKEVADCLESLLDEGVIQHC